MKKAIVLFIVVIATIGLNYYREGERNESAPIVQGKRPAPPTSVNTKPAEVFQRAFWRRPSAADKIICAERREWADFSGLKKWQWFIQVEPSPELMKYLRDENSFRLTAVAHFLESQDAPVWYAPPAVGVEILQSPRGNMCLIFERTKNLIWAHSSGGVLQPGVPASTGNGGLPTFPPPDPSRK